MNRIDDAGKLDEETIARGLHDSPAVLVDSGVDEVPAISLKARERSYLIGAHEPTVTDNICTDDRRQTPLDRLVGVHCLSFEPGYAVRHKCR